LLLASGAFLGAAVFHLSPWCRCCGYERVRAVRVVPAFTRGLTVASVGLIFAATLGIAGPR
jgi:chromate transport protein ChrA